MGFKDKLKEKFKISDVLAPLLTVYTITYIGLMIVDFVLREKFDMPVGMMAVYIALVGAYSADKEIRRWMGNEAPSKGGAIFVYAWLVLFLVASLVQSFFPTFTIPADLTAVCLQVLGIFFGSKASKKIYELKTGKAEELLTRQETVLSMIKEKGKAAKFAPDRPKYAPDTPHFNPKYAPLPSSSLFGRWQWVHGLHPVSPTSLFPVCVSRYRIIT